MNKKLIITTLIIILIGIGTAFYLNNSYKPTPLGGDRDEHNCIGSAGYSWCEAKQICLRQWEEYCTATQPKKVLFNCDDFKTINASFFIGDDKFVDLILSDDRKISVPRAMSASGARYANNDETFVFWNKGDTAFITEGVDNTQTFTNCILKND